MESLNLALFRWINAAPSPDPVVLACARLIAVWGVYVPAVIMILLFVRGPNRQRAALAAIRIGAGAAMLLNFVITSAWLHPRPFMVGVGTQFLPHAPETSLPSDHVTFILSLGIGLALARSTRWAGLLVVGLGAATGWARIYLGVHWPLDIAASTMVASAGAAVGATAGWRAMLSIRKMASSRGGDHGS